MRLTINGDAREVNVVPHGSATVLDLLRALGLTDGPVAVELNRAIVPRAEHASRTVTDGDVLEIVHMVGGG